MVHTLQPPGGLCRAGRRWMDILPERW